MLLPVIPVLAGARTDLTNKDGKTAYSLAKTPQVAAVLKQAGVYCCYGDVLKQAGVYGCYGDVLKQAGVYGCYGDVLNKLV